MIMRKLLLALAANVALAIPASATTVFSDNFDAENGGATALNYTAFANFDVIGPPGATVDIVRTGDFGLTCAGGSGSCVDLDGSSGVGGGILTRNSYGFNAGDLVTLSIDLSGSQRGGLNDFFFGFGASGPTDFLDITLGGFLGGGSFGNSLGAPGLFFGNLIDSNEGFGSIFFSFRAGNAGSIQALIGTESADNQGPLVDNVVLDITAGAVPEPASWALMIAGFGLVGGALRNANRRRRPVKAHAST
jgi:PEP-CTERM motif